MSIEVQPHRSDDSAAPHSIRHVLRAHAELDPTGVAVRDSRAQLTWAQLADETDIFADRLAAEGVGPGSAVLLLLDTCVEAIVAYWAVQHLNAVAVIGDPGCTRHELNHYVNATQPGWALSTRRGTWERLGLDQRDAGLPAMRWLLQQPGEGDGTVRDWDARGVDGVAATTARFDEATDAAVVLFSSGTTGVPKTIVHTRDTIAALQRSNQRVWGLTRDDVVLGALPFHTIYGSVYSAATAIWSGASLVLLERFKPDVALRCIQDRKVTTSAMVPAMILMMLNLPERDSYDLSSLRATYTGSATISEADIARFRDFSGAPLLASYGLSECPGAAVESHDDEHVVGAAGRICPEFEAAVIADDGTRLTPGETGEIVLRGPTLMKEYLGRPDLTNDRIRDGWIHTQDIGTVDADGYIHISGRASDMIIRGGLNIAPKEIEDVLSSHDAVAIAAVVGIDDEIYGQVVKAYVMPRDPEGSGGLVEALKLHCASLLSRAKVPADIVLMRELPMNAGGKVLRQALREAEPTARIDP